MAVSYSGTSTEFRTSVRNNLGGINSKWLKDGVIDEHKGKVERMISDKIIESEHIQQAIDDAIVTYTAEKAFKSIPQKSTISGGGLTANMAVSQYIDNLEEQSSEALAQIGVVHPEKNQSSPIQSRTDGMLR